MVKTANNFEDLAKVLLKELSGRARDVVERRFGIGTRAKRQTLESIGQTYKITRERVRQIEAAAINKMRLSSAFAGSDQIFSELEKEFDAREKVWREDEVLTHFAENDGGKNYVYFFLSLGKLFERLGADAEFYHRWTSDAKSASEAHKTIRNFCNALSDDPMTKDEIAAKFKNHAESEVGRKLTADAVFSWLGTSKNINSNNFGEWGLSSSPLVRPSGMRDFAYLVLKKHGSPLHFREVASSIEGLAKKRAHVQTVHNELIKDERFVLVGRGLYALSSWGYQPGTVKDIIKAVLEKRGPTAKEELIKLVKQERHVKDNTILINLQNKSRFKKLPDGRFHLA
ncbi:MAG: sigma factor-like helix-turn-helix DNA-binding protein [Patescibacteria group bacterium]